MIPLCANCCERHPTGAWRTIGEQPPILHIYLCDECFAGWAACDALSAETPTSPGFDVEDLR
jgi:hypothetical protein